MASPQNENILYNDLSDLPKRFFTAVDRKDLNGLLALFASDATLTVQTDHITLHRATKIRDIFVRFMDSSRTLSH